MNGTIENETLMKYQNDVISYVAEDQNLASSEVAPELIVVDENISLDEDDDASFDVLSNDSYLANAPSELTFTNPENGTVTPSGSVFNYTPNKDFFGQDAFSYTLFQGGISATGQVLLKINPQPDPPEFTISSTFVVPEGQKEVAKLKANDPDEDILTFQYLEQIQKPHH